MPNILIGSFKAAEANAEPQKALAAPRVAGRDGCLPDSLRPAVVQQHLDRPLHVHSQQLFQGVVVPVLLQTHVNTLNSAFKQEDGGLSPGSGRFT